MSGSIGGWRLNRIDIGPNVAPENINPILKLIHPYLAFKPNWVLRGLSSQSICSLSLDLLESLSSNLASLKGILHNKISCICPPNQISAFLQKAITIREQLSCQAYVPYNLFLLIPIFKEIHELREISETLRPEKETRGLRTFPCLLLSKHNIEQTKEKLGDIPKPILLSFDPKEYPDFDDFLNFYSFISERHLPFMFLDECMFPFRVISKCAIPDHVIAFDADCIYPCYVFWGSQEKSFIDRDMLRNGLSIQKRFLFDSSAHYSCSTCKISSLCSKCPLPWPYSHSEWCKLLSQDVYKHAN